MKCFEISRGRELLCITSKMSESIWKKINKLMIKNKYRTRSSIGITAWRYFLLPACIRLMSPNPLCIVYFSNTNMIPVENKPRSVHPGRLNRAPFSSSLSGTLRSGCTWCWGGREGRRQGGEKTWKALFSFPQLWQKPFTDGWDWIRPGCTTSLWWSQWIEWAAAQRRQRGVKPHRGGGALGWD